MSIKPTAIDTDAAYRTSVAVEIEALAMEHLDAYRGSQPNAARADAHLRAAVALLAEARQLRNIV